MPRTELVELQLQAGSVRVCPSPTLLRAVVDSGLVITVFDRHKCQGGGCHFAEPRAPDARSATARYGDAAVFGMRRLFERMGARPTDLEARILGCSGTNSAANAEMARASLSQWGVRLVAEEVGGSDSVEVCFQTATGRVEVRKVDRRRGVPSGVDRGPHTGGEALRAPPLTRARALPPPVARAPSAARARDGSQQPRELDDQTFDGLCKLVYAQAGIVLGPHKRALVVSRLAHRVKDLGLGSYKEYLQHVQADRSGQEINALLDAITTNVTHFMREIEAFQFLANQARERASRRLPPPMVWSAACATGEEPYSIALTLLDALALQPDAMARLGDVHPILATDISLEALGKAQTAQYREQQLRETSPDLVRRYFEKQGASFSPRPAVRRLVRFQRLNLVAPPLPVDRTFQIVFCRNVMIYFDPDVRRRLISELHRFTEPGGHLIVGRVERPEVEHTSFRQIARAIYQRK